MFEELIFEISKAAVDTAFKYFPVVEQRQEQAPRPIAMRRARRQQAVDENGVPVATGMSTSSMQFSHPTTTAEYAAAAVNNENNNQQQEQPRSSVQTVYREEPRVGRNDPCPCGSGKKYKQCHGKHIA
ncbi:MAG: SEC-C domain-containing protein [Bacteriodetes bacterium]|nr:SEC-C domain-containing protein [Bacteroidota bacterium]